MTPSSVPANLKTNELKNNKFDRWWLLLFAVILLILS